MRFVLLATLAALVGWYTRPARHRTGVSAMTIINRLYAEKHAALERHLSTSWPGTVIGRHHAV